MLPHGRKNVVKPIHLYKFDRSVGGGSLAQRGPKGAVGGDSHRHLFRIQRARQTVILRVCSRLFVGIIFVNPGKHTTSKLLLYGT